jgi:hypothetical protein
MERGALFAAGGRPVPELHHLSSSSRRVSTPLSLDRLVVRISENLQHIRVLLMQAFAHFSKHAFQRIAQRTKLSCEEIARILDRGLVVNTGRKPGLNRNHLVFYSVPDDNFFVAIQDGLTGTVVTILPLEYQANLAWQVTEQDCVKARDIVLGTTYEEQSLKATSKASAFVISGHYLDGEGNQKTKVILKTGSGIYGNEIKAFLSDQSIFSRLDELAVAKAIDPERMFGVSIRLGRHGEPIAIDLRHVPRTNVQR